MAARGLASSYGSASESLMMTFSEKTVVIVAHRLSTIKNADNIVAIAGGRVVEQGTHQQLLSNQKEYYTLVKSQMDYVE